MIFTFFFFIIKTPYNMQENFKNFQKFSNISLFAKVYIAKYYQYLHFQVYLAKFFAFLNSRKFIQKILRVFHLAKVSPSKHRKASSSFDVLIKKNVITYPLLTSTLLYL